MQKIILGLLFFLTTSSAIASSITFSATFGPTSNPFTTVIPLSAFDPAFGTLTSIMFRVSGQATGSVGVTNTSNASGVYDVTIKATLSMLDPSNTQLLVINPVFDDSSFSVDAGQTRTDSGSSPTLYSSKTVSTGFAPYIGSAGNPGVVNFTIKGIGTFGVSGNNSASVTATDLGVGTESVTYNYSTPSSTTPEPGTTTLLGSALVGIGLLARKRFKKPNNN